MSRLQQILAVVLILQIGVLVYVFLPRNTPASAEEALLENIDIEKISSVEISDNNQKEIVLAKNGDEWLLPNGGDYPVIAENVTETLDKLLAVKKDKLVTKTATSHERLQVSEENYQRRIKITLTDDTSKILYIGSSPGSQTVHIRCDGEDEVYLARNLSAWNFNTEASSWIDAAYISIPGSDVIEASLENDHGIFQFNKKNDQWEMEGLGDEEEFNEANLTALVNRFSNMNMQSPLGKEEEMGYGLSNPKAVFSMKTKSEDGEEEKITFKIGNINDDENGYFVQASNSEYYAVVSKATLDDFINRTREDFIVQQPTATPEQ